MKREYSHEQRVCKHLEGDGRVLMQIQPQYLSGVNKKSQATHLTVKQARDCDSKP
jgi:hypothetical protein